MLLYLTTFACIAAVLSFRDFLIIRKGKKEDTIFKKEKIAKIVAIVGLILTIIFFILYVNFGTSSGGSNNNNNNNGFEDYVKENYPDTYEHYLK